jgi:ABC-type nitrate/sulfonate/bicarbonate transport system substrate-binding protein
MTVSTPMTPPARASAFLRYRRFLPPLIIVLIWQLGSSLGWIPSRSIASPLDILGTLWALSASRELLLALTPADGQAAFDRGALDAWAIYGYNVVFSVNAGARVLVTSNGYLSGNYAYSARTGALGDPRLSAAIGDYLDRLRRAYAWQGDNIDRWAEVHSAALGVTKDVDLQILRTSSERRAIVPVTDEAVASCQAVADTFAELGVIPTRIEVTPLFDRRFNDLLFKAA